MKKLFLTGLMALALAHLAPAQQSIYINSGNLQAVPPNIPNIDATAFLNQGTFNVVFNNISSNATTASLIGAIFFSTQLQPYDFSDVLYFTNRGTMMCDTGFKFDDAHSGNGGSSVFRQPSANFVNNNTGQVLVGSVTNAAFGNSLVFFAGAGLTFQTATPNLFINATNIVNTGLLDCGSDGLISITGNNVNLVRGVQHVE